MSNGSPKDVHLDSTAAASPEAIARTDAELAELARLLYVGVTRACDYLVFATRSPAPAWLQILAHADGSPVFSLPATEGQQTVRVEGEDFSFAVERFRRLQRPFEPRDFDLVLWAAGYSALPYLDDDPTLSINDWSQWNRAFNGNFLGYAAARS